MLISQVVDFQIAKGFPQPETLGDPLVISAGIELRFHLQIDIPSVVIEVAKTPPPTPAKPDEFENLVKKGKRTTRIKKIRTSTIRLSIMISN